MSIRRKKIEFLAGNGSFNEQYNRGMQYALVNDNGRQVHHFVWCKDFLHDLMFGNINSENINIYNFKYSPQEDVPPPSKKIRIAVVNSYDKNFGSKCGNSLDFINQVEEAMGFTKSTLSECDDAPEKYKATGVYLFEGSKKWLNSPVLISMYTLLLRLGMTHTAGVPFLDTINGVADGDIVPYQKDDKKYSKSALVGIQRIIRDRPERIFHRTRKKNYPKNLSGYTMHHQFGIVTFSDETNKQAMPAKWYAAVPQN